MATISSTTTFGEGRTVTWTPLTETDTTGIPSGFAGAGDHTFQVTGTFGGATIVLQGSVDGTNWVTLQDGEGAVISFTSAGLRSVLESVPFMRPFVSGGSGTSLTAKLFSRKREGK